MKQTKNLADVNFCYGLRVKPVIETRIQVTGIKVWVIKCMSYLLVRIEDAALPECRYINL